MPLGYYLAQGMIPLGYSSSDDEEGPCELPNGRIVCGPHGLVVCHRCCTDYSIPNELLDDDVDDDDEEIEDSDWEEDDEDEESKGVTRRPFSGSDMVRGTGKVFPSKFVPSNSNRTPLQEFPNRHRHIEMLR
jgi:ribonuclease HI